MTVDLLAPLTRGELVTIEAARGCGPRPDRHEIPPGYRPCPAGCCFGAFIDCNRSRWRCRRCGGFGRVRIPPRPDAGLRTPPHGDPLRAARHA